MCWVWRAVRAWPLSAGWYRQAAHSCSARSLLGCWGARRPTGRCIERGLPVWPRRGRCAPPRCRREILGLWVGLPPGKYSTSWLVACAACMRCHHALHLHSTLNTAGMHRLPECCFPSLTCKAGRMHGTACIHSLLFVINIVYVAHVSKLIDAIKTSAHASLHMVPMGLARTCTDAGAIYLVVSGPGALRPACGSAERAPRRTGCRASPAPRCAPACAAAGRAVRACHSTLPGAKARCAGGRRPGACGLGCQLRLLSPAVAARQAHKPARVPAHKSPGSSDVTCSGSKPDRKERAAAQVGRAVSRPCTPGQCGNQRPPAVRAQRRLSAPRQRLAAHLQPIASNPVGVQHRAHCAACQVSSGGAHLRSTAGEQARKHRRCAERRGRGVKQVCSTSAGG